MEVNLELLVYSTYRRKWPPYSEPLKDVMVMEVVTFPQTAYLPGKPVREGNTASARDLTGFHKEEKKC